MIRLDVRDEGELRKTMEALATLREFAAAAGLWADIVPARTMIAARANEFGCVIPKTPKMRAFLAALARRYGIKLDPTKGQPGVVVIPPRPFIRSAVDEHRDDLEAWVEKVFGLVWANPSRDSAMRCLRALAFKLEQLIKAQINRVNAPPLHPLTVAVKKSDKPLVHTGTMRRAIRAGIVRAAGSDRVETLSGGG